MIPFQSFFCCCCHLWDHRVRCNHLVVEARARAKIWVAGKIVRQEEKKENAEKRDVNACRSIRLLVDLVEDGARLCYSSSLCRTLNRFSYEIIFHLYVFFFLSSFLPLLLPVTKIDDEWNEWGGEEWAKYQSIYNNNKNNEQIKD